MSSLGPLPASRFGGLAVRSAEELANERRKELHHLFPAIRDENEPKPSTVNLDDFDGEAEEKDSSTSPRRRTPLYESGAPLLDTPNKHQAAKDAIADRRSSAVRFRRDDSPRWDILHPHSKVLL